MTWDVAGNRRYLEALNRRVAARQALTAIASHGYVDGYAADLRRESTTSFGKLAAPYGKKIWVTEGGFGGHAWPAPLHELAASFLFALRDGGVSLLTVWQSLTRYPPTEHGLMSVRGPTKKTYAAMQFWRFIRPGMVRISADVSGRLDAVAFEDTNAGKTVLVLLNRTRDASSISLRLNGKRLEAIDAGFVTDSARDCAKVAEWRDPRALTLPPESVATLVLRTRDG
jgi:O-glycosyl hydrolase